MAVKVPSGEARRAERIAIVRGRLEGMADALAIVDLTPANRDAVIGDLRELAGRLSAADLELIDPSTGGIEE